jgi:hypothetical protein
MTTIRYGLSSISFPWIHATFRKSPKIVDVVFVNSIFTERYTRRPEVVKFCMKEARNVSASHVQLLTLQSLIHSIPFGVNLESLNLTDTSKKCLISCDRFLSALVLPRTFSLVSFNFSGFQCLTDNNIALICESFPKLTSLNLSGCLDITDRSLVHVVTCLKLTTLDISQLKLSDCALSILSFSKLSLSHLALGGYPKNNSRYTSRGVCRYVQCNGSELLSLDISGIWSNVTIISVGKTCHNLTFLNMGYSLLTLHNDAVQSLCENCVHITELNVNGCIGLSVENSELLTKSLPNLSALCFVGCQRPVQFSFFSFMIQKLSCLILLDLRGHIIGTLLENDPSFISVSDYDTPLGSFVSVRVQDKCSRLTHFVAFEDISGFTFLSYKSSFKFIVNLKIINNDQIQDCHLTIMCADCPSLLCFHVRSCSSITSTGVVSVCFLCQEIEEILLDGTGVQCRIGDAALLNGLAGLRHLRKLSLFKLPLISSIGFGQIVASCLKLNDTSITACVNLGCETVCSIMSRGRVLNSCLFSR